MYPLKLNKCSSELSIACTIFIILFLFLFTISHNPDTQSSLTRGSWRFFKNSVDGKNSQDDVLYIDVDYVGIDTEVRRQSEELQDILSCYHIVLKTNIYLKQDYWILENYVQAKQEFKCHESITLTTQGDFTLLDNLVVLVEKWHGPISVALYAPGDDFGTTLESIAYLRNCRSDLVIEFVTFHIIFDVLHIPKMEDTTLLDAYIDYHDCSIIPYQIDRDELYKQQQNLTYPTNIARNLARRAATTHFVFPIDIELYPSPNFIRKFLQMIANDSSLADKIPSKVFVLPVFQLVENGVVPKNKTELQDMIKGNMSFVFHAHLCSKCQKIPKYQTWLQKAESDDLNVFTSTKRLGHHAAWEPFFVGTNSEPWFDERLTWEGPSNKITQGLIMCLLDYDYMVLDNAFLIYKLGIKTENAQMKNNKNLVLSTSKLLKEQIKDIVGFYGYREGCQLMEKKKPKVDEENK